MAIKLTFDPSHNVYPPTFALATRSGRKLGSIPATGIHCKDNLSSHAELMFSVHKFNNNIKCAQWDKIQDFKLLWCKEWDTWFEINVELNESDDTIKNVSAKTLGEAELSQINLYTTEINTESDILRDDYVPTVLFDSEVPEGSLLTRIMEKAPHYKVTHVDASIAGIQRTFTFDGVSIYDAFQTIAQEIGCIFVIDSGSNEDGKPKREIRVYDLMSYCLDCGKRNDFVSTCPECGSTNVLQGYGKDTTIFLSTENLADNIVYATDTGAVKNCFKLQAGDDLLTATIVNCNPNGSGYIWYISDKLKEDMSNELVSKLEEYDQKYAYYQKEHIVSADSALLTKYNGLVDKYAEYSDELEKLPTNIVGYPSLMTAYYNTIDFELFLEHGLMPPFELPETSASQEASKFTNYNIPSIAVSNIGSCSAATVTNAIQGFARTFMDDRYRVLMSDGVLNGTIWTGNLTLTNYSDDTDTYTRTGLSVDVTDNYETFVKQRITKTIHRDVSGEFDFTILTDTSNYSDFDIKLGEYSLAGLESLKKCCQTCIDILIEQGAASGADAKLNELYNLYRQELSMIESEITERKNEIAIVVGSFDSTGYLTTDGVQSILDKERTQIQEILDFENFLGEDLWLEFVAYRREDTYQNDNYISDGLNNAELFDKALEFIDVAKKEIIKSATLQHSITSTLKNLLVIKEFEPIVDYFEVGNWLRIRIDDEIYRLRLIDYEVNFDDLNNLSVTFSDVLTTADGTSDVKSVLDQAASMATSYGAVSRQAEQGKNSNQMLSEWVEKGLSATAMKIVNDAENQDWVADGHGMIFRKYDPITEDYDKIQLKIINSTIAITSDGWDNVDTAIGCYYYIDPETGELTMAYGVNGEVLVGKVLLGEKLGIYNSNGSMSFDKAGLVIKNGDNTIRINPNPETYDGKLLAVSNSQDFDVFYIDVNGAVNIDSDNVKISNQSGNLTFDTGGLAVTNGTNSFRVSPTPDDGIVFAVSNKTKDVLYIDESGVVTIDSDNFKISGSSNSLAFDANGLTISNGRNSFIVNPNAERLLRIANSAEDVFYIDQDGELHIKADGSDIDLSENKGINDKIDDSINTKMESIDLVITNGESSTTIKITGDGIETEAKEIKLTGMVTFADLEGNGTTTINGANIKTGAINASLITTGSLNASLITTGSLNASLITTGELNADLITTGTLNADKISLKTGDGLSGFAVATGSAIDDDGNTYETHGAKMFGSAGIDGNYYFMVTEAGAVMRAADTTLYVSDNKISASQEITVSSDRRVKHDIDYDMSRYEAFYESLRPVSFKYNYGNDTIHTGFIAQEVHESLGESGLDITDFAALSKPAYDDGLYSIAYGEFVSLNTYMIQKLMKRVTALENERIRNE